MAASPKIYQAHGSISRFKGDYHFLSNFHRQPFYLAGWSGMFDSAEHAFQASKALTGEAAGWVREASSPELAKSRGRQIETHLDWDRRKRTVMARILLAKFTDPELAAKLAATYPIPLIEGNTWGDTYWGAVGHDQRGWEDPSLPWWNIAPGISLAGHNWLGRTLMMVRELVRDET